MKSSTTRRFRAAYAALPEGAQRKARLAYQLFRENPPHPSLQFKKVDEPNVYSVRVGLGYRALGVLEGSDIVWFWIGPHSEYDKMI
jgi:hypothetical protein